MLGSVGAGSLVLLGLLLGCVTLGLPGAATAAGPGWSTSTAASAAARPPITTTDSRTSGHRLVSPRSLAAVRLASHSRNVVLMTVGHGGGLVDRTRARRSSFPPISCSPPASPSR